MKEEWRPAKPPYSMAYEVSSRGRVRSLDRIVYGGTGRDSASPRDRIHRGRIKKPTINASGYPVCRMTCGSNKSVEYIHVHVAFAFLGEPPAPQGVGKGLYNVNHIDGDKTNNTPENLEWITCEANHTHAASIGLLAKGSAHHASKFSEDDIPVIIDRVDSGESMRSVSRDYGVSHETIRKMYRGLSWKHVG